MITVFSDDSKHLCELVAEYIKVMTMIKEIGKPQVIPRDTTQRYGSYCAWWVVIDDGCGKFSTTMEKVYSCATDFAAGYKAGREGR